MAPKLYTIGTIAEKCKVPVHRVRHILATRGHIEPAAYAGQIRLYENAAIALVLHELNVIDASRKSKGGAS